MTPRLVPAYQAHGYGAAAVTPHHLATQAALEVLTAGGNAIDAAIAANAVQGVVAPETCGVGGDLFVLVHRPGDPRPAILNSSGRAGRGADPAALRAEGCSTIPYTHPQAVTVPGCVDGWSELATRFGSLSLRELLSPALHYAKEGFAVSAELADSLAGQADLLATQSPGRELYPSGSPPRPGDRVARPELAATLADIAAGGRDAFYTGRAGEAISRATNGAITMEDLAESRNDWVEPLGLEVFGLTAWTVPPNSQGYLTLASAWLFEHLDPPRDPENPDYLHLLIEAHRAVAWERNDLVADPAHAPLAPEALVDPDRLGARLDHLDRRTVAEWPPPGTPPGGTAYLCVLDADGMGVSFIQSNFTGFGGCIAAEGAGFFLHNRGAGFDLRPGHPNELAPGKRPLHTLSPTLWTDNGRLALLLGTRGGHYQPQLLVQAAAHHLYAGLSPAGAQAVPRWVIDSDPQVLCEATSSETSIADLRSRGHDVSVENDFEPGWGPVSMIHIESNGLRTAAADPRVPTAAAAAR